jgi:hypothetical protein
MSLEPYYNAVANGATVTFRPRGSSMTGIINNKDEVVVVPCEVSDIKKDVVVLCKVKGRIYLHKVLSVQLASSRCLIGNNKGGQNGWTSFAKVVGRVKTVNGHDI